MTALWEAMPPRWTGQIFEGNLMKVLQQTSSRRLAFTRLCHSKGRVHRTAAAANRCAARAAARLNRDAA